MKKVTLCKLKDGSTHYRLRGQSNGPVAVLVHGGTVPSWIWDSLAGHLTDAGYRVLTYDQFGRGLSELPRVVYDRALYARQLGELVERLELQAPFDLVGLSLGGATAVNFTAHHPRRVRKLVLIAPVVHDYRVPRILRIPLVGDVAVRLLGVRLMVKRFADLARALPDFESYRKKFVTQTTRKGFYRSFLSMMRSDALGNYDAVYRRVGRQGRRVLLIWGRRDREITADMIDDARKFLPNAIFSPVADAGHGIVLEKPDIINDLIEAFLAGTHRARAARTFGALPLQEPTTVNECQCR